MLAGLPDELPPDTTRFRRCAEDIGHTFVEARQTRLNTPGSGLIGRQRGSEPCAVTSMAKVENALNARRVSVAIHHLVVGIAKPRSRQSTKSRREREVNRLLRQRARAVAVSSHGLQFL